jgi:hypothetical protein
MGKVIIFSILSLFFISCGKDGQFVANKEVVYTIKPANPEQYEYEFRVDGCTTGIQKFDTFLKACEGLKDSELNNECAEASREDLFTKSICPGQFKS